MPNIIDLLQRDEPEFIGKLFKHISGNSLFCYISKKALRITITNTFDTFRRERLFSHTEFPHFMGLYLSVELIKLLRSKHLSQETLNDLFPLLLLFYPIWLRNLSTNTTSSFKDVIEIIYNGIERILHFIDLAEQENFFSKDLICEIHLDHCPLIMTYNDIITELLDS